MAERTVVVPAPAPRLPSRGLCPVCGQACAADGACPNSVCRLPDRWFSRVHTVSERSEEVWAALRRYKYDEERGWARILGRLLGSYLDERRGDLDGYDLVTTCALYTGPEAPRLWDYLRPVLDVAQAVSPGWPVAHGLIEKSGPTPRFMGLGAEERRLAAEGPLRAALSVPEPGRVAGRRVLVFDDVYSEGYSLREMARVLVQAGAAEVAGLVLTRRKGG
jgi:predicted amidophosphoribosyltransferase